MNTQEKLLHQLHHSFNLVRRGHHDTGERTCGHRRGQGRLLNILIDRGTLTQAELADIFQIRPSSLSELIDKLEAKGFVTRSTNAQDKRFSDVTITDAGKAKAEEISQLRQTIAEHFFEGLSTQEQEQLLLLLDKFTDTLETKLKNQTPPDNADEFYLRRGHSFPRHNEGCHHRGGCRPR